MNEHSPRTGHDLLDRVLGGGSQPSAFALLHRPEVSGPDTLEVLTGAVSTVDAVARIPLSEAPDPDAGARQEVLALIPYRQLAERGYACADDGEPLIAITVEEQTTVAVSDALRRLPGETVALSGGAFDLDDDEYAGIVRKVIADEIGTGEGANFVIKRSFVADITGYTVHSALAFFRRLLEREQGAYWTFVVHTGDRTFVGASPERHVSLRAGRAVMNPISGTYRYPASGPTLPGVMDFLADRKEADELYMVVDEELKMMARICDPAPRVVGPYLKEMARLAHTEYFIEGASDHDPRTILRETLFAPTVTGSPLESACRVINRYEPRGRGYYSGVAALIGQDERGRRTLDSSILIRTADIDGTGRLSIGVGATLVRHSDPESEVDETRAKAAGLLAALGAEGSARFAEHPRVREALERRNDSIAGFWTGERLRPAGQGAALAGRRVLVVDAEDTFTSMIGHQLRAMGLKPTVRRFDEPYSFDDHELVVMGPGPGDPRDTHDPKITHLRSAIHALVDQRRPFLAVCLSHQVLSTLLGLELVRRPVPNQGVQREIDLFGARERVGFYNTFAARSARDAFDVPGVGLVEASRDDDTGEVHALRGPGFASMQFHAESVLTQDGVRIVGDALEGVLRTCAS
ncbi:anthranilate synthase family protein [Streptomyces sp. NPDC006235]|uniref:anthranilate synthase family protein n=1 Tax=Streptomyces sp. NPDC006235 TaxID=3156736 RepID=UPI0033BA94AF